MRKTFGPTLVQEMNRILSILEKIKGEEGIITYDKFHIKWEDDHFTVFIGYQNTYTSVNFASFGYFYVNAVRTPSPPGKVLRPINLHNVLNRAIWEGVAKNACNP